MEFKILPRDQILQWLETNNLSPRTKKEYMYYLDKFNESYAFFTQKNVNSFILRHNNNVARALLRNLKEYLLEDPHETLTNEQKGILSTIKLLLGC